MAREQVKKNFSRLPSSIVPINYKLKIFTDLAASTFSGEEEIEIDIKSLENEIVMNSLNLKVTDVVFHQNNFNLSACDVVEDKENELIYLRFHQNLPLGHSIISFKFEGILNNNLKAYYRSTYTDVNGIDHIIAATQFEPADARRAFPCWDEPAVKATFDITLVAPKNKVVLSNTNVTIKEEGVIFDSYTFAKTPIMSTYLVAFVIGDFDSISAELENGLKISVYTRVGKSHMGKYALNAACKTVPFYEKYFGVSYPLPKLDLIAIPDFAAGAMENWGLITYREVRLFVDEKSSAYVKEDVAIVVGHEIAHQWFGNLVTMEWWTHLWLNEGFATWVEYLSVDHCYPSYNIWKRFIGAEYARALELDGLCNSHPIEVEVGPPSEIEEIFDAISYSKGASVIRMLYDYIGHDAFAGGLSNYLKHFSYQNAKTADLWKFLSQSSNKSIETIMGTWTSQMGYPIITVSQKIVNGGVDLSLSQERFISDGSKSKEKMSWIIPLSIVTSENPDSPVRVLFDKESTIVHIPLSTSPKWIRLNYGQVGFYRVKYSDNMYLAILSSLQAFTPVERLGILNDSFALAKSGSMETTKFLDLFLALSQEKDNTVWEDISSSIMSLSNLISYSNESIKNVSKLKEIIRQILAPIFEYVGLDDSSSHAGEQTHQILLLRTVIIGMLIHADHTDLIQKLRALCESHISGSLAVAPDIRIPMFIAFLSTNEESNFNKLIEYYKNSHEIEEKVRILKSMSGLSKPSLIQKALELSISGLVRTQDFAYIFTSIASNFSAREFAWKFLKQNWSLIFNKFEGGFTMNHVLKESISRFADLSIRSDIKNFFEQNPCANVARSLQQGLESIQNNHIWLQRDEASITSWLFKH